jgi:hypothetical protein
MQEYSWSPYGIRQANTERTPQFQEGHLEAPEVTEMRTLTLGLSNGARTCIEETCAANLAVRVLAGGDKAKGFVVTYNMTAARRREMRAEHHNVLIHVFFDKCAACL